jgi:hypothetical protein
MDRLLDQKARARPVCVRGGSPLKEPAQELNNLPLDAQQALHHGREVLRRELGIGACSQPEDAGV